MRSPRPRGVLLGSRGSGGWFDCETSHPCRGGLPRGGGSDNARAPPSRCRGLSYLDLMPAESWASSPSARATMLGNRSRDTRPERALRSRLHTMGFRFRKDYRLDLFRLRVRPDVLFTRRQVAVFVDGCFWHSCPEHGNVPTRNAEYWVPKLARNVQRDRQQDRALNEAAWTVVRVWEHEPVDEAVERVASAVMSGPLQRDANR